MRSTNTLGKCVIWSSQSNLGLVDETEAEQDEDAESEDGEEEGSAEFWDYGELLNSPGEWLHDGPVAIYPLQISDRMRAQRGWFTMFGNSRSPLEEHTRNTCSASIFSRMRFLRFASSWITPGCTPTRSIPTSITSGWKCGRETKHGFNVLYLKCRDVSAGSAPRRGDAFLRRSDPSA